MRNVYNFSTAKRTVKCLVVNGNALWCTCEERVQLLDCERTVKCVVVIGDRNMYVLNNFVQRLVFFVNLLLDYMCATGCQTRFD